MTYVMLLHCTQWMESKTVFICRSRVQNMNEAFRTLKEKVPGLDDEDKNFSKLEVLQCTISYLQHLYKVQIWTTHVAG